MKIEAGKYYVDGHGEKRGPMKAERSWLTDDRGWGFLPDGQRMAKSGETSKDHLVSEWLEPVTEGPVRTVTRWEIVTRREIVPGVYGRVVVRDVIDRSRVIVQLEKDAGDDANLVIMTAHELRSAAMILSQIAEALDDAGTRANT